MYKKALFPAMVLISTSSIAQSNFQFGIGYSLFKTVDSYSIGDYEDSINTPLLDARYVFNDNVLIEGSYRLIKDDMCTQPSGTSCSFGGEYINVSGVDVNILIGRHFTDKNAVYYYSGIGYFSDSWSFTGNGINDTISGIQIPIGVGYHFENLSIEAQYMYRSSTSYSKSSFDINTSTSDTYFGSDLTVDLYSLKLIYSL
ncbi:hypothetical protein C0J08_12230 [Marinomonas sp. CT5]|uniref:hypothetical protein n=1 Tax=Marinomonas sp. CT5 TaxID=2066133 RepID=UPI001BAFF8FC|nr:hypothetical protein [Marinomonas sp. CT5]QUX96123.1 hypothetical protein C0J08_12230 [Marinomonas sp. CT5]